MPRVQGSAISTLPYNFIHVSLLVSPMLYLKVALAANDVNVSFLPTTLNLVVAWM